VEKNKLYIVYTILIVALLLTLQACSKSVLKQAEYKQFVMDNDYPCFSKQELSAAKYYLRWLPPFYGAIASNQKQSASQCQLLESYNANPKSEVLEFLLQIKMNDLSQSLSNLNNLEKNSMIAHYLSSDISKDIQLVTEMKDTLPCISAQFERHFSIDDTSILLLHFVAKKNLGKEIKVVLKDQIFHQGEIQFNFKTETYYQLPKLDISDICS
jgi:hypothetical protein